MAMGTALQSKPAQLEPRSDKVSTHTAAPNPAWLGLLLPSVTDLIFLILLVSLAFGALAPRLLGDAGIGWHIRNGQQMLATHSITRADSFSSSKSGQPWYAWEWLYDVAIAKTHDTLGLNGVVLFTALVIAATFALLFRLTLARGGSLLVTIISVILAVCSSAIHLFARPHVLSWLFTVIWFQIVDSSEATPEGNRRLWYLPVLMFLWVNLHGGFLLGVAILGLYLLAGLLRLLGTGAPGGAAASSDPKQWLKKLAGVTGLTLLATMVNPYGYKLHVHVYDYLSNRFLMNHIDEFRSPDFHGVAQQCFAALLLITIVALASARNKIRASHLLVVIFAAYSGLYASRNLPTSSLLLTLIVAPVLSQTMADANTNEALTAWLRRIFSRLQSFSVRMGAMEQSCRGHLWPVAAAVLLLAVCTQHGRLGSRQLMDAHFDAKRFPVEAADYVIDSSLREPIFAPDYWGGYLIYRFYPEMKVVVDDRHDFYGEQFLKNYLNIVHVEPGWETSLDQLQTTWVLAPAGSSLANILKESSHWKVTHEDKTAVMFHWAGIRE
jgi:hypothetical protein